MEACALTERDVGHIDTTALKILIESKIPLVLLDAREAAWDNGHRIPGAVSIINARLVQELLPEKEALIIVYCSHQQCGASGRLAKRLHEQGYHFVLKYSEGIEGWISAGHSTITVNM